MKPIALASDHAGYELKTVLAGELEALGVAVVNCTPGSALDVFAKVPLEQALADRLQHPAGPLRR